MTTTQGGADTVRALVRGTRTALYVQLIVAAIILVVTVGALLTLKKVGEQLQAARAELGTVTKQRNDARDEIGKLRASTQDLLRGRDSLVGGRFDAAVASLTEATTAFPSDPVAWSLLAQAYHGQRNEAQAVDAMRKSLALPLAEDTAPSFGDYARLATYQCVLRDHDGAAATVRTAPDGFAAALQQDANLTEVRAQMSAACAALGVGLATAAPMAADSAASAASAQSPFAVKLIYLHIRSEADRADAQRLQQRLVSAGFRVPGIELVPAPRGYGANLRYYYEPQAAQAHTIAQLVSGQLHELAIAGWSDWTPHEVSLAGAYDNLPRDRVEVWLPPRTGAAN